MLNSFSASSSSVFAEKKVIDDAAKTELEDALKEFNKEFAAAAPAAV